MTTTNQQGTRTVYLLLTRSETYFSRLIHHFTDGEFTHASIGLEGPSGSFYSFGRKYPRLPFPGGMVQERVGRGFFGLHPQTPCRLYELKVSEHTYEQLRRRLEAMYARRELYHYNLLGTVTAYFNRGLCRPNHYFCSQFVAEMLVDSGAADLPRQPALTRPMDICGLKDLRPIFRGRVGALGGSAA